MKTVSKQMIILDALEQDSKTNGEGLSISELSHIVFGNFHKSTKRFHEKKISTYMGAVCELGAVNNLIVFAVKENVNKKTPEIKSRISKWRILDPKNLRSIDEFTDALNSKKKNGEAHTLAFKRMFEAAKTMGVLSSSTLEKFEISLQ